MPAPFDNIVQHLFHQPSLHSVTVDELETMATEYPYFAAAHFLLLKKMQDSAHPGFNEQLHKTTLYFNNPLWLRYLLQPGSVDGFKVLDQHPFIVNGQTTETAGAEEPADADVSPENGGYENHPTPEPAPEPETTENLETSEEEPAHIVAPEGQIPQSTDSEQAALENQLPAEAQPEITVSEDPLATEHGTRTSEEPEQIPAEIQETDKLASAMGATVLPSESQLEESPALRPPMAAAASLTIIDTSGAKEDLLFEPYHTVDYFASQGISLSADNESKDKLGRQLRSFTDWLKTMKKLPQASIGQLMSAKDESKVLEDAAHSIENKEVVTETMAEVFEKQGLHEEAAEIYRKLSLLNPSKSTYFAAKIEALKN